MPINPETLLSDLCLHKNENGTFTLHAAGLIWQQSSSTNKYRKIGIAEMPITFEAQLAPSILLLLRLNTLNESFFGVLNFRPNTLNALDIIEDFATFSELAHAAVLKAREVITSEIAMRQEALAALTVGE